MMGEGNDSGPDADDGVRELAIPIKGTKGQDVIVTGRIRTKLDDATREAIVNLLADALVAEYHREVIEKGANAGETIAGAPEAPLRTAARRVGGGGRTGRHPRPAADANPARPDLSPGP